MLSIGDFSVELCGGTHVNQTGDIGFFKIVSESGIASGIRRIEAVTGQGSELYFDSLENILLSANNILKSSNSNLIDKITKLHDQCKLQEKQIKNLKLELTKGVSNDVCESVIGDITVVANVLLQADMDMMRNQIDQLKSQKSRVIAVLATENEGKAQIVVGVSKSISKQFKAGDLASFIAGQVGGKGGGRPDMAQAGGNDPAQLSKAMSTVNNWVEGKL